MGFELQGAFKIAFANEKLEAPARTYANNFKIRYVSARGFEVGADGPAVALGDVAGLDFSPVKGEEVEVLAGGPPCQDFSIVRGPQQERRGVQVKRGKLYIYFIKALLSLKPVVFVFENVPGLINTNNGLAYKTITEDFENPMARAKAADVFKNGNNLRYQLIYNGLVRFQNIGVPQSRKRLIIVGVRNDAAERIGEESMQEVESIVKSRLEGEGSLFSRYPLTPIEVFEGGPLPELQERYHQIMKEYEGLWNQVNTQTASEWKTRVWDTLTFEITKDYLFANKIRDFSKDSFSLAMEEHKRALEELGYMGKRVADIKTHDNWHPRDDTNVAERMRMIPPGLNHEFVRGTKWEVEGRGMSLIYRRLNPIVPSYTVVAYGGGGTWGYHYERGRATLTNRERARLQAFPDLFEFDGSSSQIRAQIGEAVPPLAAKRIAESVAEILNHVRA